MRLLWPGFQSHLVIVHASLGGAQKHYRWRFDYDGGGEILWPNH
jgi:hypothetical protein